MPTIKVIEENVVYDNPVPHLRSRHGFFPGMVQLPSGELLALFVIGEAFESVDLTTYVSRSHDLGRTWELEGPLYDKSVVGFPTTDYFKPTVLGDGSLIAIGYRFHRRNPEEAIGNPATNGIQPGDNLVSFSRDEGRTWSTPEVLALGYRELLETSGPCIELESGELLATCCPYPMWDGTTPSGHVGILLRSSDGGRTWDDTTRFFTTPEGCISPYESRLCQMPGGCLVAIVWAYDVKAEKNLTNRITVSHDGGRTWSPPIDTGILGQASNLLPLGENMLLSIHAQREGDIGLYVRLVDLAHDRWRVVTERNIWGDQSAASRKGGLTETWASLKFGQPVLLALTSGEILAVHWCIQNGQGRILSHRLQVDL